MRIIARLDVKNDWVIKGIHLEGLRKVGTPVDLASRYYGQGIHELLIMDAVASLYDRNTVLGVIEKACERIFVPITVGGGIRSIEDVSGALSAGADKVAINTALVRDPGLATGIADRYGSQCLVGSIEAKRKTGGGWEAYVENGREPTGIDVLQWAKTLENAGVGELLLTSVDQEGTRRGFDIELLTAVLSVTSRPVIIGGGFGTPEHLEGLSRKNCPGGVAIASAFHYRHTTPLELKQHLGARTQRVAA